MEQKTAQAVSTLRRRLVSCWSLGGWGSEPCLNGWMLTSSTVWASQDPYRLFKSITEDKFTGICNQENPRNANLKYLTYHIKWRKRIQHGYLLCFPKMTLHLSIQRAFTECLISRQTATVRACNPKIGMQSLPEVTSTLEIENKSNVGGGGSNKMLSVLDEGRCLRFPLLWQNSLTKTTCKESVSLVYKASQSLSLKEARGETTEPGGTGLAGLFPSAYSACFLKSSIATFPGVTPCIMGWILPVNHSSRRCSTDLPTGHPMEICQIRFSPPRWL